MVEWLDEGMNGWMGGWLDGWMDGWMDGWIDGWIDGWVGGWVVGWMDRWIDGWVDGWMDGWMGQWLVGWLDGGMDGCMDKWVGGWMDSSPPFMNACINSSMHHLFIHPYLSNHPLLHTITQVMIEVSSGFKMGVVKFVGETEFASGELIGVALDRPFGKISNYHVLCF